MSGTGRVKASWKNDARHHARLIKTVSRPGKCRAIKDRNARGPLMIYNSFALYAHAGEGRAERQRRFGARAVCIIMHIRVWRKGEKGRMTSATPLDSPFSDAHTYVLCASIMRLRHGLCAQSSRKAGLLSPTPHVSVMWDRTSALFLARQGICKIVHLVLVTFGFDKNEAFVKGCGPFRWNKKVH